MVWGKPKDMARHPATATIALYYHGESREGDTGRNRGEECVRDDVFTADFPTASLRADGVALLV